MLGLVAGTRERGFMAVLGLMDKLVLQCVADALEIIIAAQTTRKGSREPRWMHNTREHCYGKRQLPLAVYIVEIIASYHCLSNALHSSIGQNIKSLACPVSDLRCPVRVWKTSNGHNSVSTQQRVIRSTSCLVLGWVFFSKDRLALFNLTAHELHELYYDRPSS